MPAHIPSVSCAINVGHGLASLLLRLWNHSLVHLDALCSPGLSLSLVPQVGLWKSQAGAQEAGHEEPQAAALELREARGALAQAEAQAGRLRQGQTEVRRRAEEARQAVLLGLRRVRELEALARQVPELQRWGRQLEGELRLYR